MPLERDLSRLLPKRLEFQGRSRSVLSTQTNSVIKNIILNENLQNEDLKLPAVPNFISTIFAEVPDNTDSDKMSVGVPSKSQMKQLNGLVSAFYNDEPIKNPQWETLQAIKKHLKKFESN